MACRNHCIRVSDETWESWERTAQAKGLSVTKAICQAMEIEQELDGALATCMAPIDAPEPHVEVRNSNESTVVAKDIPNRKSTHKKGCMCGICVLERKLAR